MLKMDLGKNNFAVLADTISSLSRDQSFVAAHPVVVNAVINFYDYSNIDIIEALGSLIQFDKTLQMCVRHELFLAKLRQSLERLLDENDGNENNALYNKIHQSLETTRSLLDVTSFFHLLEIPDSEGQKLAALWIRCCQEFPKNQPILYICSRILSKATESEVFCQFLRQPGSSLVLASTSETHIGDSDMLVRLLYAMGNCLVADVRCRQNNGRLVQSIRRVFRQSCRKCESSKVLNKQETEVLLKVIRVIANFSLDEPGAVAILQDAVIIKAMLWLLKQAVEGGKLAESNDVAKYCLAALNNLIFFAKKEFEPYTSETTHAFINCLMKSDLRITAECCRALGNLSHYPVVCSVFEATGADRLLHTLLDSSDINLVVNVIGIFINFSLKCPNLEVFAANDRQGIFKLLVATREFEDMHLSTLTLQLIWNLLRNATEVQSILFYSSLTTWFRST